MQRSICILVSQPPYGNVAAAEAVRHISGALAEGFAVVAALVDDGVWLSRAGHRAGHSGFTPLSGALHAVLHPVSSPAPRVVVHRPSLDQRELSPTDLVSGVELVDDAGLAETIASARFLLRF